MGTFFPTAVYSLCFVTAVACAFLLILFAMWRQNRRSRAT